MTHLSCICQESCRCTASLTPVSDAAAKGTLKPIFAKFHRNVVFMQYFHYRLPRCSDGMTACGAPAYALQPASHADAVHHPTCSMGIL